LPDTGKQHTGANHSQADNAYLPRILGKQSHSANAVQKDIASIVLLYQIVP